MLLPLFLLAATVSQQPPQLPSYGVWNASDVSVPPSLVSIKLVYPDSLRRSGRTDQVHLRFTVDTAGRVLPNSVSELTPVGNLLDSLSESVVRQAVFQPGRHNGQVVTVRDDAVITYPATGDPSFVVGPLRGSPNEVFSVDTVEVKPAVLSVPPLFYPDSLRRARIQGSVVIEAVVDTLGHAEPASVALVVGVHPVLDSIAMATARQVLFRPARVQGRAVRVLIQLPFNFVVRH